SSAWSAICHTGLFGLSGCTSVITVAYWLLMQLVGCAGLNLATQTSGWSWTVPGLMSSEVAAAAPALYAIWGSVLRMAAVRPPARPAWLMFESVLNAIANSMIPKVRR